MGMFNNNLEIDKEDPFKYDKLQREEEIKNLTSIFNIVDNQMVLAVNSKWGTGKTSFLKMWNQYLMNNQYKTIFFNAWENDYVEEPFIAFVDEIRESIKNENAIKGFMEKAKDVGLALAKQSPKMISKAIKNKTGFDSEEIISDDELTQIISDKIDNYNKNKKSVDKFRQELESLASKELKKPIIIFVDELDRCRPDFAIRLLERIKHFFNVQNIIFVLGIDKEALSNSIKVIYGDGIDINGYLTRFIDIEYKLKDIAKEDYIEYLLEKYNFRDIFEKRNFDNYRNEECDYEEFKNIIEEFILNFDLTLRDLEKVIANVYMIIKARYKKFIYTYPLLFLCVLRKTNNLLYSKVKDAITFKEFMTQLNNRVRIEKWFEDISQRGYIVKAFILWIINDNIELEQLKEKSNVDDKDRYSESASLCVECYENVRKMMLYRQNTRKIIFEEVELYDNFTTINGK